MNTVVASTSLEFTHNTQITRAMSRDDLLRRLLRTCIIIIIIIKADQIPISGNVAEFSVYYTFSRLDCHS